MSPICDPRTIKASSWRHRLRGRVAGTDAESPAQARLLKLLKSLALLEKGSQPYVPGEKEAYSQLAYRPWVALVMELPESTLRCFFNGLALLLWFQGSTSAYAGSQ